MLALREAIAKDETEFGERKICIPLITVDLEGSQNPAHSLLELEDIDGFFASFLVEVVTNKNVRIRGNIRRDLK